MGAEPCCKCCSSWNLLVCFACLHGDCFGPTTVILPNHKLNPDLIFFFRLLLWCCAGSRDWLGGREPEPA
jgi:hypothetical protein